MSNVLKRFHNGFTGMIVSETGEMVYFEDVERELSAIRDEKTKLQKDLLYYGEKLSESNVESGILRAENERFKRSHENMEKEIRAHLAENEKLKALCEEVMNEHMNDNDCDGPGKTPFKDCQWCRDAKELLK